MGCNCGKSRGPLSTTKQGEEPPKGDPYESTKAPSGRTQTFALRRPDGVVRTYGSLLEAKAARVRLGGGGRIVPS